MIIQTIWTQVFGSVLNISPSNVSQIMHLPDFTQIIWLLLATFLKEKLS